MIIKNWARFHLLIKGAKKFIIESERRAKWKACIFGWGDQREKMINLLGVISFRFQLSGILFFYHEAKLMNKREMKCKGRSNMSLKIQTHDNCCENIRSSFVRSSEHILIQFYMLYRWVLFIFNHVFLFLLLLQLPTPTTKTTSWFQIVFYVFI